MLRKNRYIKGLFIILILILLLTSSLKIYEAKFYPFIVLYSKSEQKSFQGYILFAPTEDDIGMELDKPNKIYLIDMEGKIAHTWQVLGAVQLAKLKPDGNLIYSTRDRSFKERAGIREIDPYGNVIWYFKCWIDHDFYIQKNDNIMIHYITSVPS